jgi:tripartite-type tricarboxylate transporter receptor subunit TctC
MLTRRILAGALLAAAAVCHAQTADRFPSKPIRVLVGFAAGGNTDVAARIVAHRVSELLGQPLVVENRPGAGGNLAGAAVAKAPADGYTLLVGTLSTQVLNTGLGVKPAFNAQTDFVPLALTNQTAVYLGVSESLGVHTLAEFAARAKAKPGSFSYAVPSVGGVGHLAATALNRELGIVAIPVVYKGSSPAAVDLAGGSVQYMLDGMVAFAPLITSKRIRVLAVSGNRRNPEWPDVPTFSELGLPRLSNLLTWNGWFAPAATPKPIVNTLNKALVQALTDPAVVAALQQSGNDVAAPMSPQQAAEFVTAERRRWQPLMREAAIKPE